MAMSLNKVMLIGNLTRDPELKTLTSGQPVATLGVATNRVFNDKQGQRQDQTEFHNVVAWGKLAEICQQYMTKGRKVYVEGRLQTREWTSQDGTKHQKTEIVAENIIMLDRAGASTGGAPVATNRPAQNSAPRPGGGYNTKPQPAANDLPTISLDEETAGFRQDDEVKIEDIPF